jgi:hypothetical protein
MTVKALSAWVPAVLYGCTGAVLLAGGTSLLVWGLSGDFTPVAVFFRYPGAVFLVGFNALGFALSVAAVRQFSRGEPLHGAWLLIATAAGCQAASSLLVQVLGQPLPFNPFQWLGWQAEDVRRFGLSLGGPVRMAILAGGLACVLRLYRRLGLRGRLAIWDWIFLVVVCAYILEEIRGTAAAVRAGKRLTTYEVLHWSNDPLLILLLAQAMLLRRSVLRMGNGLVGRCWGALATAVFLTLLGDMGIWATAYGLIPWPYTSVTWLIWFPAAAAGAIAPAYQLLACRQPATMPAVRRRMPVPELEPGQA